MNNSESTLTILQVPQIDLSQENKGMAPQAKVGSCPGLGGPQREGDSCRQSCGPSPVATNGAGVSSTPPSPSAGPRQSLAQLIPQPSQASTPRGVISYRAESSQDGTPSVSGSLTHTSHIPPCTISRELLALVWEREVC